MIEPGKILQQRYRIDKQIGQGGMGAVYVATDERFGSTVAIKETLCMDDNFRKALEREARLLNSLKHVALPRVSDHFLEENGQFLVMEYIPGEDLSFILAQNKEPFPFETVLRWADQLLDALEFLHSQSMPVIHRDIKPQNLKLTARDQIVLLDFGLAKGNPTDAGVETAAKSLFGYSRNYASLEQIQGTGTDPRSDLYSLAATLYHLATGQPPEDALTRAMAVLSNQPDPLVPANAFNEEVPAGFAGILRSALDLNAAYRPASAAEMRKMLKELDAYAHLVDYSQAATVANADFGSQKTKLMPGLTHNAVERRTGAKTEVLPGYVSEETALRAPLTDGGSGGAANWTPRKIAAIAAGLLLLLGSMAAGAYMYEASLLGDSPETFDAQVEFPPAEQPVAANTNFQSPIETSPETSPAETVAAAKERPGATGADKATSKPSAKTQKGNAAEPEVRMTVTGSEDDPTVTIGNIRIKDARIETPDALITENGIVPKVPRVPPSSRIGPGPDMRQLTPAQRRRLNELRRKGAVPPDRSGHPERPN